MIGISDFVRGTLTYVSNCAIAFLTLVTSGFRFQPVLGAVRCKVRQDISATEYPDSRAMLFIASCLLAIVSTSWITGVSGMALLVMRAIAGVTEISKATIVTAIALYFTCEWTISRAAWRSVASARGDRKRHILRFLIAALLIHFALLEIAAVWADSMLQRLHMRGEDGGETSKLGSVIDGILVVLQLVIVVAPYVYVFLALKRSRSVSLTPRKTWRLALLPINLMAAVVGASFVIWLLYPRPTPQLASLRCIGRSGSSSDMVSVDATFVNNGDQWWRPSDVLILNLKGYGNVIGGNMTIDPRANAGGTDPLVVPPKGQVQMRREVAVDKGQVAKMGNCSLYNGYPAARDDFYSIFMDSDEDFDKRIHWTEINPTNWLDAPLERSVPPETASPGPVDVPAGEPSK